MNKLPVLTLSILLLLTGCYETVEQDGQIVRTHMLTGEMHILRGDQLVKVQTSEDLEAKKRAQGSLAKAKIWKVPERAMKLLKPYGFGRITIRTSWRDGAMAYKIYMYSSDATEGWTRAERAKLQSRGNFIIFEFEDEAKFNLLDRKLLLSEHTLVVFAIDTSGNQIRDRHGLLFEGKIQCEESLYRDIVALELAWNLPDSLLKNK